MKTTILSVLFLAVFALGLSSCKEETTDNPQPAEKQNYLLSHSSDGSTTTYHYTGSTITMATVDGIDSTWFEYDGNGKLVKAMDNSGIEASLTYNGGTYPSTITSKENGVFSGVMVLTTTGGNVTKVETYSDAAKTMLLQKLDLTYNGSGSLTTVQLSISDGQGGLIPFAVISNITTDGKTNPYGLDFAIAFMNIDNPFAFGKGNITAADVLIFGNSSTLATSYTYNSYSLPTTADMSVDGSTTTTTFVYGRW